MPVSIVVPAETFEFVSNIEVYRSVYPENSKENSISRHPAQRKSIPKRSNREVTISPFGNIAKVFVDKGQRTHDYGNHEPTRVRYPSIWVKASFAIGISGFEYV